MKITNGRQFGIKAQAPRNYSRAQHNLPQAQIALDNTVARAQRQLIEAMDVDGVPYLHWSRAMQGFRCTCQSPLLTQVETGQIPDATKDGIIYEPSVTTDLTDRASYRVRGFKDAERRTRDHQVMEAYTGDKFGLVDNEEARARSLLIEHMPKDAGEDLLDPNSSYFGNAADSTVPVTVTTTPCGICLGTGLTEGYTLTGGKRLILDASGQIPFTLSNFYLDTDVKPYAFQTASNKSDSVAWALDIPTHFEHILSVSLRNNLVPATGLKAVFKFAEDTTDIWQPLTTEALMARKGLRTRIIVRVVPLVSDNQITVAFTHVEINFMFQPWQEMQMPQMNDVLNTQYFESIQTLSLQMPPTQQLIQNEDFIYDSKYDRLWKVVGWTDSKTARSEVMGWQTEVRALLRYDYAEVLRTIRDPNINIAYGRLDEARYRSTSGTDQRQYVINATSAAETARSLIYGIHLADGGEFLLDPDVVVADGLSINKHSNGDTYLKAALAYIKEHYPHCATIWLSPNWFGSSVNAQSVLPKPRIYSSAVSIDETWLVNGLFRSDTTNLSSSMGGFTGGTISDASLIRAIDYIHREGFKVGLRPELLLDMGGYPLASSILGASVGNINTFFGTETALSFEIDDDLNSIEYVGNAAFTYSRFILHYAAIASLAGVEYFLIGSNLDGLTRVSTYNLTTVAHLLALAMNVKALSPLTVISYEASLSEINEQTVGMGKVFPLDALYASTSIDFVALKYDVPLTDWRKTQNHLDGQLYTSPYDLAYLHKMLRGGEGFDYRYTSSPNRDNQTRTALVNWQDKLKDVWSWWGQSHPEYNTTTGAFSANSPWVAFSKPLAFTTMSCPAVDLGTNDLSKTGYGLAAASYPYASQGARDDLQMQSFLYAFLSYWVERANNTVHNGVPLVLPMLNTLRFFYAKAVGKNANASLLHSLAALNGRI